jgi:hypothetical protein
MTTKEYSMYALLNSEGQIETYPYSINQLQVDNPGTSFPSPMPDERLVDWNVVIVVPVEAPPYDPITQNLTELTPQKTDGVWMQAWEVSEASPEEVAERTAEYNEQQKQNRLLAYERESDPIFFKWQRGEGTQQEWLDAVELVKQQYPYIT